jgi:hypothetical protein
MHMSRISVEVGVPQSSVLRCTRCQCSQCSRGLTKDESVTVFHSHCLSLDIINHDKNLDLVFPTKTTFTQTQIPIIHLYNINLMWIEMFHSS